MVFKDVNVIFNKQNSAYFPGEILEGKLSFFIHSSKALKVSELYIKFNGVAKVSWSVSDSKSDSTETTTYSSSETYFKVKRDIIKTTDQTFLTPGEHFYKFSFHLQQNLPSTFKGNHGEVTYILKIRIKIPWKLCYKYEFPIKINSNMAIRNYPNSKLLHHLTLEKTYSSCCATGAVSIDVTLPRTAYVRGETISIAVNVENDSNVTLKDLVFKLRRNVEFISNFPRTEKNSDVSTIGKIHSGPLPSGMLKQLGYGVQIPSDLEIFDLRNCNIINFNYILCVTAIFRCASGSLMRTVPLVIANK